MDHTGWEKEEFEYTYFCLANAVVYYAQTRTEAVACGQLVTPPY
jgi:hypothetical protein